MANSKYNQLAKQEYAIKNASNGKLARAKEIISQDEYLPVLKKYELHPEIELPVSDFNQIFDDIKTDLDILDNELLISASKFEALLIDTSSKLKDIKTILLTEKERQEDLNILCNAYTDFNSIILTSDSNAILKSASCTNNVFSLSIDENKAITYSIEDISGNGYEGNNHVYKDGVFANTVNDTSDREYIHDGSLLTHYEYSRITASSTEQKSFPKVNFDSIKARCSLSLKGDSPFNTLEISTDSDVILESFSTSLDGVTYHKNSLADIPLNDKGARYESKDYVYGSGILSFKDCKYIKLTIKAGSNSNDVIAFSSKTTDNTEQIDILTSAKRSTVKISEIALSHRKYKRSGEIVLSNFISDSIGAIAIFSNEYIADDYDLRSSISYTLTLNGIEYDIIPINSHYNGKKIVRTTSQSIAADYVHYISENIKSATLTVKIKSDSTGVTPFLSDLKVLIGEE